MSRRPQRVGFSPVSKPRTAEFELYKLCATRLVDPLGTCATGFTSPFHLCPAGKHLVFHPVTFLGCLGIASFGLIPASLACRAGVAACLASANPAVCLGTLAVCGLTVGGVAACLDAATECVADQPEPGGGQPPPAPHGGQPGGGGGSRTGGGSGSGLTLYSNCGFSSEGTFGCTTVVLPASGSSGGPRLE